MNNCKINADGAKVIADGITYNESIHTLLLANNHIDVIYIYIYMYIYIYIYIVQWKSNRTSYKREQEPGDPRRE